MELTTSYDQGAAVIAVAGRLDSATAAEFEAYVLQAIDDGASRIVFELSALEFISSAGLRGILATAKRVKPLGGKVSVCGVRGVVGEVFSISGFRNMMPVVETLEEALAAV